MYLVATAWVKNEASYLKEWLDFHIFQGFEKFYIYDNFSTDNTEEVLSPYIKNDIVELRHYPDPNLPRKNFWVMSTTINEFKNVHTWLFHHSIDEYMFCPNGQKVSDFLRSREAYPGIVVPWRLFNSSGKQIREPGRVIDRFNTCVNDNAFHIKTIIQPKYTIDSVGNPHAFTYTSGDQVYSDGSIAHRNCNAGANGHSNHYDLQSILIHHYVCMSREEYDIKMNKGLLDLAHTENIRRSAAENDWNNLHNSQTYICNDLVNYKY